MEQSTAQSSMNEQRALAILSALADGVNPITGEVFPADSPYQSVEIVRALVFITRMLESKSRARPRTNLPSNAGKPWNDGEDERLLREFDRGQPLEKLAEMHGRTVAGIQARLERHGRIKAGESGVNPSRMRWQQRPQQRNGAAASR
ncbi:MAG TPA: hypothetical protein VFS47_06830 [Steroidobacteraceae bacterium]|nr:hypothetical protein [Steroidobacteraceae bacterium]